MKKMLFILAVFSGIAASAMTLSAFTTLNKTNITEEKEYTLAANDNWKKIRENVPYCDGDGSCEGYGSVWVNNDTYQVAFTIEGGSTKYDLAEYTSKEGYNMRFWYNNKYHYVNIYIPSAAFDY